MKKIITLSLLCATTIGPALAQCPPGETELTMTIVTDRYGDETTWEVTGPGGSPVHASGGPYTLQTSNGEYPQPAVMFCVPDGSILEILVEDAYGDGMCCAYGDGSWTLSMGGTDIASGGSFGSEQTGMVALGTDLGIAELGVDEIIGQGTTQITGTVVNNGIVAVNSFTLSYAVDGGTPITQAFNTTIAPGESYVFTFTTPWEATVGVHSLDLELTQVANDMIASNNLIATDITVATQTVDRRALIEEFTSSTCVPCAGLNQTFDPLLNSWNTNMPGSSVLAVKYQMDWPSPGNDPSYNADGATRQNYYNVTGIPDVYMNGGPPMGTSWANAIQNAVDRPAFCDILIEHTLTGTTAEVEVTVTPYADFPGTHKLYIAATENYYYYPASTTTQDDFHYAMRKMLPNGNGITMSNLVAGVPQTFSQSHTFTIGNPAQGNYNTWSTWLNNITFVAFVQNQASKNVLQSSMSAITTGIDENENELGFGMFPNPSTGLVNFDLALDHAGNVDIVVMDLLGAVVHSTNRSVGTGAQQFTIDLNELANGSYLVQLRSNGMMATRKLTINR